MKKKIDTRTRNLNKENIQNEKKRGKRGEPPTTVSVISLV